MLSNPASLIELDWAHFDPWAVMPVTHRISDHPRLQIEELVELAKRLESKGRIRAHTNAAEAGTSFSNAPDLHPVKQPLVRTMEHIAAAQAWMSLLNVQTDPLYRELVDEVLDSVRPNVELKDPGMSYRGGWIFVSSPKTVTPFHVDKEHNFILQIKGQKTIYVWEPDDLRVVSDRARDRFHSRHDRSLITWREEFRKLAHCFKVGPGQGAYMPSTSPHLVEVGDEPSITVSFTYYTDSTRRDSLIHKIRGRLSELGVDIPSGQGKSVVNNGLYLSARAARAATRAVYRATGRRVGEENAVYARAENA
ncbi:cupin-like domain-containing protein [Bradyrhizobium sp. ORS 111]|uniref:cupin-like domain-containing protein n=1 Tax=Bradyrhizobium sp. ORS 111 TaxID=1685958 RepID=UPI00389086B2